jgi:hypothetical protein
MPAMLAPLDQTGPEDKRYKRINRSSRLCHSDP